MFPFFLWSIFVPSSIGATTVGMREVVVVDMIAAMNGGTTVAETTEDTRGMIDHTYLFFTSSVLAN